MANVLTQKWYLAQQIQQQRTALHQLQQPLRTMTGDLDLLGQSSQGRLDAAADAALSQAVASVAQMRQLLREL